MASVHNFSRNAKHMGEHKIDPMCHTCHDFASVLQSYKLRTQGNLKMAKKHGVDNRVFTVAVRLQRRA